MHWIEDVPLLGLDLETTHRDPTRARPVTAALTHHIGAAVEMEDHFPLLINPGIASTVEAARIHGITDAQAQQGMPLAEAIPTILDRLLRTVDQGAVVVGANIRYDLTVVLYNARRLGLLNAEAILGSLRVADGMLLDRWWDRYRRGGRNLLALCEHYGVSLRQAHDATADAVAAVNLARAVLHRSTLDAQDLGHLATGEWESQRLAELGQTRTPEQLHRLQQRWHADNAESYQDYRRQRGDAGYVEDPSWPVVAYRAEPDTGAGFAARWWESRAGRVEHLGAGRVAMAREELERALASAFEAGRAAARA